MLAAAGSSLPPTLTSFIQQTRGPCSVQLCTLQGQGGRTRSTHGKMHICEPFLQFSMYADFVVVVANGVLICTKGKPHMRTADHTL